MKEAPLTHKSLGISRGVEKPYSPLQQKIDDEIRAGFESNFTMHLPCDNDDQPNMSGYRAVRRLVGAWDITHGAWIRQRGLNTRKYSQRMLHQTGEEFYNVFDAALAKFHVDEEEARRYSRPTDEGGMTRSERQVFRDKLAPVYRRLRTIGYTYSELIS